MSTTSLIIEHLIAGIQAGIWLTLLVLTVFGFTWLNVNSSLKDYSTAIILLLFALVYPFGVAIDNFADIILGRWKNKLRSLSLKGEGLESDDIKISGMALLHKIKDDFLESYLAYIRMRIRVMRSFALNIVLSMVSLSLFVHFRLPKVPNWKLLVFIFIPGTIITTISLVSWRSLTITFYKQIARGHNMLKELDG